MKKSNEKVAEAVAPMSAARARLAEAIAARAEFGRKVDELQVALDRLRRIQGAVAPIQGELVEFDSAASAKLAEWSRAAEGAPPVPRASKREGISERLFEAQAMADAARQAEAGALAEQSRESAKLASVGPYIRVALAEVLAESAEPMIQEFECAQAALAVRGAWLSRASDALLAVAEAGGRDNEEARPLFQILEKFNARIHALPKRPSQDDNASIAAAMAWNSLAARLGVDASAVLEA